LNAIDSELTRFQDLLSFLPSDCAGDLSALDDFFIEFHERIEGIGYQALRLKAAKLYHRCVVVIEGCGLSSNSLNCHLFKALRENSAFARFINSSASVPRLSIPLIGMVIVELVASWASLTDRCDIVT
jgi:hypothetical protein